MMSQDLAAETAFARLLAEARAGSSDALGCVLMEYRPYLLRLADRQLDTALRRKACAADLVQEAFVEALRDFARFQGERREELRAWLSQILHYRVTNTVRHYRDTEKRAVDCEMPLREMAVATSLSSDEVTAAREEAAALASALPQLPEHYQLLLYMRYQERRTYAQISATLNCSAESARKMGMRALTLLRKMLRSHQ